MTDSGGRVEWCKPGSDYMQAPGNDTDLSPAMGLSISLAHPLLKAL